MPSDPVPPPTGRPIVFYSPHQDDETLFMAQVIANHALAGRNVHVVLCSNGSTSGAFGEINGTVPDPTWWGAQHFPAREGYAPLTKTQFGLARTRELLAACGQLGVFPGHIHNGAELATSDLLPDNISVAHGEAVLRYWAEYFLQPENGGWEQVGHYTMHWADPNSDHANLGQALRNLRARHPSWFADARWLVKPEEASDAGAFTYNPPSSVLGQIRLMQRHAGYAYRSWQPANGVYGIGYHSVGLHYFGAVESGQPNHMVKL